MLLKTCREAMVALVAMQIVFYLRKIVLLEIKFRVSNRNDREFHLDRKKIAYMQINFFHRTLIYSKKDKQRMRQFN